MPEYICRKDTLQPVACDVINLLHHLHTHRHRRQLDCTTSAISTYIATGRDHVDEIADVRLEDDLPVHAGCWHDACVQVQDVKSAIPIVVVHDGE